MLASVSSRRLQHRLLVLGQRTISGSLALFDSLTNATEVEGGPLNARAEGVAFAHALCRNRRCSRASKPQLPTKEDAREQVTDCDADLCRRRGQLTLGDS